MTKYELDMYMRTFGGDFSKLKEEIEEKLNLEISLSVKQKIGASEF